MELHHGKSHVFKKAQLETSGHLKDAFKQDSFMYIGQAAPLVIDGVFLECQ